MEHTPNLTPKEWAILKREAEIDTKTLRGEKKPTPEAFQERLIELAAEEVEFKATQKEVA